MDNIITNKNDVIDSLSKEIQSKNRGYEIIRDYQYQYGGIKSGPLDLVEIDNNKVVAVYQVVTFYAYWQSIPFCVELLKNLIKLTEAKEAYIAFFDCDNVVQYLSLNDLETKSIPVIPFKDTVNNDFGWLPIKPDNPISQFITILYRWCGAINNNKSNKCNSKLFFRGQPNVKYKPLPSIFRTDNSIENENVIYNEAIQRNPSIFTPDMTAFDNLVKMQHYELPTRLLDITANPLVALYFACSGEKDIDEDGEVLVYLMPINQIKYRDNDVVCLLANLARRPQGFQYKSKSKQCTYLHEDVKNDKPTYNEDASWDEAVHDVYCVLPKPNNDRIIKQDGAFFIFGMGETKNEPASLKTQPSRIIIKASAKQEILQALDLLGINEAALFPEPDKVMHQIKKVYC